MGIRIGLSKQPNMSIQNLSCKRIKNPIYKIMFLFFGKGKGSDFS